MGIHRVAASQRKQISEVSGQFFNFIPRTTVCLQAGKRIALITAFRNQRSPMTFPTDFAFCLFNSRTSRFPEKAATLHSPLHSWNGDNWQKRLTQQRGEANRCSSDSGVSAPPLNYLQHNKGSSRGRWENNIPRIQTWGGGSITKFRCIRNYKCCILTFQLHQIQFWPLLHLKTR